MSLVRIQFGTKFHQFHRTSAELSIQKIHTIAKLWGLKLPSYKESTSRFDPMSEPSEVICYMELEHPPLLVPSVHEISIQGLF